MLGESWGDGRVVLSWDHVQRGAGVHARERAVGEGQVQVCNEGGDLAIGDLIVTSSTAGVGMKQSDDTVHSYTVARCREAVTFSGPGDIQTVACIYHCG